MAFVSSQLILSYRKRNGFTYCNYTDNTTTVILLTTEGGLSKGKHNREAQKMHFIIFCSKKT